MVWLLLLCFAGLVRADDINEEIARAVHQNHIKNPPQEEVLRSLSSQSINDYLETLDPYSVYLSPEENRSRKQRQKEGYIGIGAELIADTHRMILVPYTRGPLYRAGIRQDRQLLAVNGGSVKGLDIVGVAKLLSGPAGSSVTLTLRRIDGGKTESVSITRVYFRPNSVETIAGTLWAYISIRAFVTRETASAVKTAIRRFKETELPLILDLRHVRGGDLHEAIDTASIFLGANKLQAITVDSSGKTKEYYTSQKGPFAGEWILLIVGPNTTSAGEVLAAAIQYHKRGLLVGQETYGKCTSQVYIELSDGSALKITNLNILRPSGEYCHGKGLQPDMLASDSELSNIQALITRGIERLRTPIERLRK
jgi:carboxyl-terminal processing protease